jgi:hypothetical protein
MQVNTLQSWNTAPIARERIERQPKAAEKRIARFVVC